MPRIGVPGFTRPSIALFAGAMVASIGLPFAGTPSVTLPCALRTLAWPARPTLSLLRRGRTRIAATGVGAEILARQGHLDQPLDVAKIGELLATCDQRDRGPFGAGASRAADAVHIGLGHVG